MCEELLSWKEWSAFFAARANRPLPRMAASERPGSLPRSLARSLAVFQLGESGGGTVVEQARRTTLDGIDEDYADAVRLFVAEENRHADILAQCVTMLGGKLLRTNWTTQLFVGFRRLLGLRFKIMVLLAAEVVGLCYYHLIAARLPCNRIGELLSDLVEDERAHLRFHCRFLQLQTGTLWRRALFVAAWRLTMYAAGLVVLIDHYPAIRDLGMGPGVAWRRFMLYSRIAERRVLAEAEPFDAIQPA